MHSSRAQLKGTAQGHGSRARLKGKAQDGNGPFGMGNPSPTFCTEGITIKAKGLRSLGSSGNHYRLALCDQQGFERDALYFNAPSNLKEIVQGPFCLVFGLRPNLWRGVLSWDIIIKELWPE